MVGACLLPPKRQEVQLGGGCAQECPHYFTNPQLCFGHEACRKTETCPFGRDKPSLRRETQLDPARAFMMALKALKARSTQSRT